MNEDDLIRELRAQAVRDAEAFREKFPNDEPNEKWLDNSFTAALPLAAAAIDAEPVHEAEPRLFAAYKQEIARVLGMRSVRPDAEPRDHQERQEPTPGEK